MEQINSVAVLNPLGLQPAEGGLETQPRKFRLPGFFSLFLFWFFVQVGMNDAGDSQLVSFIPTKWQGNLISSSLALLLMSYLIKSRLSLDGLEVADLGFIGKFRARDFVWGIGAGAITLCLGRLFVGVLANCSGVNVVNADYVSALENLLGEDPYGATAGIFMMATLFAGLLEEVVFRGCAFASMRAVWGRGPNRDAMYLSITALIFAFMHSTGHVIFYLDYFASGLFFGYVYLKGSLNAAILAHITHNALALIL